MVENAYRDPIYNLKAVVERTGVSADALRAWERRYGLPSPGRTDAGHRVYSQRDIEVIHWLVARQQEGLRIGRAVKLWKTLQREGRDPLRSMPLAVDRTSRRPPAGDSVAALRKEWVSACLDFDEGTATAALSRAFAMFPPEIVCSQIVGEGIARMGRGWHRGEVTVQQEHFASELALRRLEALIASTPPPTRRGRVLVMCPPEEEHTIGLLTLALLLRQAGWEVIYLGANVPLAQTKETIEATEPDLLVMGAQQLYTAARLLETAVLARQLDVLPAFGGRIFNLEPGIRRRIPGYFLGATLDQADREAERLMTTARRPPEVELPDPIEEEAWSHFRDRRTALESGVWRALSDMTFDQETVRELNRTMARTIMAALRFGDIELAGRYLDWFDELEERHRATGGTLGSYLRAYHEAAAEHLGAEGAVIVEWLAERVDRLALAEGERT